jgi:hypothetical protein
MAYTIEGKLLEVCDCNTLCPCWVGDDPDNGTCKSAMAWHFDKGNIDGVDISGLTFAAACNIPGNVLNGNWKIVAYMDERATPQQEEAILAVWTGKKGGPVAELAQLVGEVAAVERVPIVFDVHEGKGHIRFGNAVECELEPFRGPDGKATALTDSIFSTIPGAPAYVGKASRFKARAPQIGVDVNLSGHNAIQGTFRFAS